MEASRVGHVEIVQELFLDDKLKVNLQDEVRMVCLAHIIEVEPVLFVRMVTPR